jgi:mRNA interferase RelE/StbE
MTYSLEFKVSALKEWRALGATVREQFRKKLAERLSRPRVAAAQLRGMPDCYKIKLQSADYRLVYQVVDTTLVIVVVAVGKRERAEAYRNAARRLKE